MNAESHELWFCTLYFASILSKIDSCASSDVLPLFMLILDTTSYLPWISFTPQVHENLLAININKFTCQSLCHKMQFNEMNHFKWVGDNNTLLTSSCICFKKQASAISKSLWLGALSSFSSVEASSALEVKYFWNALVSLNSS